MDTFRTRAVRTIRAGWGIFGLGLVAGLAVLLLGGRPALPLALGLAALAIAMAFALNLMLLVILWRRGMRKRKTASESVSRADAPSYEQPASM